MRFFKKSQKGNETQSKQQESQASNEMNTPSNLSIFTKEKDSNIKAVFGKIKHNLYNGIQSSQNTIKGLTMKMQEVQEAAENWKNFSILFFLGSFFILLSFAFLPVFAIVPAKFAGLFSFGSVCILSSIAVMKGTMEFIKVLIQKDKIFFSISYIITIAGTLYYSILYKSYFYAIIFSIAQIISLSYLVASTFPGGVNGMKFVARKLFGLLKRFCCLFFKQRESSYLPI